MQSTFQIQNLVVARYRDGKLIKGVTYDFSPQKKIFHVVSTDSEGKKVSTVVYLSELKAVFFVKSLEGRKDHPPAIVDLNGKSGPIGSTKVKITFYDGEVIIGTTQGYTLNREGFFIVPVEEDTNNLRIYVISKAMKNIEIQK